MQTKTKTTPYAALCKILFQGLKHEVRPMCKGIYHEWGTLHASQGAWGVRLECDYPISMEEKFAMPDGEPSDGEKFRASVISVLQKFFDQPREEICDYATLRAASAIKRKNKYDSIRLDIGGYFFSAAYVAYLCRLVSALKESATPLVSISEGFSTEYYEVKMLHIKSSRIHAILCCSTAKRDESTYTLAEAIAEIQRVKSEQPKNWCEAL